MPQFQLHIIQWREYSIYYIIIVNVSNHIQLI